MKITCQNNVNVYVAIQRFSHVGGGGPGMFVQGYTMPGTVARDPKGETGALKIGAGFHKGVTLLSGT